MDYNKLCDEILKLHPQVRFAGVYNTYNGEVYEKFQKGINRLFDKEQTKKSMMQAYMRWKTRSSFSNIIGQAVYALTKYEKLSRITMSCGKNALLLVSIENNFEFSKLLDEIIKTREKFVDKESSDFERNPTLNF